MVDLGLDWLLLELDPDLAADFGLDWLLLELDPDLAFGVTSLMHLGSFVKCWVGALDRLLPAATSHLVLVWR